LVLLPALLARVARVADADRQSSKLKWISDGENGGPLVKAELAKPGRKVVECSRAHFKG